MRANQAVVSAHNTWDSQVSLTEVCSPKRMKTILFPGFARVSRLGHSGGDRAKPTGALRNSRVGREGDGHRTRDELWVLS